ncbi:MAG: VCBS repeat-containing protein [Flavobacteriales bacterium]|nr:VCBS repeat-containing protein [Flavobacteriales bacterium]
MSDLDGDSFLDAVSADSGDDEIKWFKNMGDGTFGPKNIVSGNVDGARSLFAADVNQDGDMDLMATCGDSMDVKWYENIGGGVPRRRN